MNFRKNILTGCVALAALIGSFAFAVPAQAADHTWGDHMAVSLHGDTAYYAEGGDEADARSQAMFNCQRAEGDTACTRGTSVPMYENWSMAAIACYTHDNMVRPFSAGSEYGTAYENALKKARNVGLSNCYIIDTWY